MGMEEAVKLTIIALKNLGMEALAWLDKEFPRPQNITHFICIVFSYLMAALHKLKEAPIALKNLGQEAWAWFDEAYPSETRAEIFCIAQSYLVAATVYLGKVVMFMVQKLKETPLALKNSGQEAWAWFDEAYSPETRAEIINIAQSYLIAATVYLGDAIKFMFQKFKETPLALKNFGQEAWAWFDETYPPEIRAEIINQWKHAAQFYVIAGVDLVEEAMRFLIGRPYLMAVVVVVVAVQICRCCGGGGAVKMMKAPGRNLRIPRASFQGNPRGYFRDLRTRAPL